MTLCAPAAGTLPHDDRVQQEGRAAGRSQKGEAAATTVTKTKGQPK